MRSQSEGRNGFLSELQATELELLQPYLVPVDLRAGTCLHSFGAPTDDVIFPHSGLVVMTMPLYESAGAGVGLVGREGMIGGFAAAASIPATCNAEVCIGGQASRMSASAFRCVLDQSVPIRRRAARHDSALLAQAQQTASCNATHPVEARICRCLLEIQDRNDSNKMPFTQAILARMLGVRRTTVTMVARRLEDAGVLRCHRGYLEIINANALERHSCDCYRQLKSYAATLFAPHAEVTVTIAPGTRTRVDPHAHATNRQL